MGGKAVQTSANTDDSEGDSDSGAAKSQTEGCEENTTIAGVEVHDVKLPSSTRTQPSTEGVLMGFGEQDGHMSRPSEVIAEVEAEGGSVGAPTPAAMMGTESGGEHGTRGRSLATVPTHERARAHIVIDMPPEVERSTRDVIVRNNMRNLFNLCCYFLSTVAQSSSNSSTRASKVVFAAFAFGTILFTPARWTTIGVIVNVGVLGMAWDQGIALFVVLCTVVGIIHGPHWIESMRERMASL